MMKIRGINRISMMSMKREVDLEQMRQKAKLLEEQHEDMILLSAIDSIVQLAEHSGFCDEFLELADRYITFLADRQGISRMQAVLFSLFVELSATGSKISVSDIACYMGCCNIKVLKYQSEIDGLVRRGLLRRYKKDDMDSNLYGMTSRVFIALADDEPYRQESYTGLTGIQFFQKFHELTYLRRKGELSTELLVEEAGRLFDENENLDYVRCLRKYRLEEKEDIIMTLFCLHPILFDKDIVPLEWVRILFDNQRDEWDFVYALQNGSHPLLKKKLIEPAFSDGLCKEDEYSLTELARKVLLKGFDIKTTGTESCQQINHRSITPKELFFDGQLTEQLGRLGCLMDEKEYRRICKRLEEKGMRQGFACLFYGAPGTGKTESALQLAKQSGRDILQVNISEMKSKWVGESEKNIKAVFDRYRMMLTHSKKAPILLFNEADAILGMRKQGVNHAVDKMENTIQNIILQEMENMKGIMIATTNMEQNLDMAFERRFLYKLKFEKPSIEQRRSIWKSFLPILTNEEIEHIAGLYNFSGGQIENIARKYNIDSILYGEDAIGADRVSLYCREETVGRQTKMRIGF